MSIQVGDILKIVATIAWLDGNLAQNVFAAVITGSGGPYDEGDILADALTWVGTMYANLTTSMSDECDGSQVQVYIYDSVDDDWDEVGTDAWTFNPSDSAHQLPRGVAALINCGTTDPDVQGKKYLPGLGEASADDGLWGSSVLGVIGDFADDWLTAFVGGTSGADWQPGVWSPTNTNFFAADGTAVIPAIPAYQRRRKRGVGV